MWRQGSPPAPTPSLAAGRPSSWNSRWSELPVLSSRTQLTGTPAPRGRVEQRPLDPRARGARRGAQPEAGGRGPPRRATAPTAAGGALRASVRAGPAQGRRGGRASRCRRAPPRRSPRARRRSAGAISSSRPASDATTPTPEALSLAPGAPAAESVWAMTMRRQLRGVSKTPITLRERPRPGTRNPARPRAGRPRGTRASSGGAPAPRVARRPGRGPQDEIFAATPWAIGRDRRCRRHGHGQHRCDHASSCSSSAGSVTGARQAKCSHT